MRANYQTNPNNPFVFRPLVQWDHYLKAQRLRSRVAAQRLRNRIGHVHRDSVIPKICLRSAEVVDPLPRLDKVSDVRDAVEKLIADVYASKLHPKVAAGLAPRLNLQLRAVEATDLERRLAKVEHQLAKDEAEGALEGNSDRRERDSGKSHWSEL